MAEMEMKKKEGLGIIRGEENGEEEEEKKKFIMEGISVLDFDMLCATVALQAQTGGGFSSREKLDDDYESSGEFGGGVQRMWEGEILDCFEDRRIAVETACCPCYRFGKNMRRAGFGPCFIQGGVYLILTVAAIVNYIAYAITNQRGFLYLAIVLTVSSGTYLGFFRRQIRKQFNIGVHISSLISFYSFDFLAGIMGSDSPLDDCVNHLICPCCTLCQESRTLDINNVQDGVWRGRGDTICIGSYGEGSKGFVELHQPPLIQTKSPDPCSMQRASNGSDHSWSVGVNHSEPLVSSSKL
ncbi:hypothetical protein IFM89_033889 [Coptis chinensis]|uniref:Uncharacterized protein n=1 Tax=Coptis chinensis TaxID=261450 RepID=A0A835LCG2_9MAGN|nr:hypothetical protein IFM89_033889 [Coptis chinensis]